jgi:rhodanese-related sulfurtransferase
MTEAEPRMHDLAKHLRANKLFKHIPLQQLSHLLESSSVASARAGEILLDEAGSERMHLVLLAGEIEAERTWTAPDGRDHVVARTLAAEETGAGFAFLGSASRARVRALTDVRYLAIDGDIVDELVGWNQRFAEEFKKDPELLRRMGLIRRIGIFHDLPMENVSETFRRMHQRVVQAGETVVTQGEPGDAYYLIDTGEAEVVRTDPFTDETACVAHLGPGDGFGEESLVQEGLRNATVTMIAPGKLLVLDKSDFDELVRSTFVEEITAEPARELIDTGQARWIDCRYDMEYEESRIPGARLMPLDSIRSQVHTLEPDATYIVYCRSGRRSKAAAFLLRERNLKAMSLVGGITAWPYEVEVTSA